MPSPFRTQHHTRPTPSPFSHAPHPDPATSSSSHHYYPHGPYGASHSRRGYSTTPRQPHRPSPFASFTPHGYHYPPPPTPDPQQSHTSYPPPPTPDPKHSHTPSYPSTPTRASADDHRKDHMQYPIVVGPLPLHLYSSPFHLFSSFSSFFLSSSSPSPPLPLSSSSSLITYLYNV